MSLVIRRDERVLVRHVVKADDTLPRSVGTGQTY